MPFIFLFLLLKVGLSLLFVTLVALLMAEFFPMLADKAVVASAGTVMAPFADFLAMGLNYIAKYAGLFVDWIFSWLRALGIDVSYEGVKSEMRNVDIQPPAKGDKPAF